MFPAPSEESSNRTRLLLGGFCPGFCKTSALHGARKGGVPRGQSGDGGSLQRPWGPAGASVSQAHGGPCRKRKPGRGWGCGEAQSRRSPRVRPRAPRGGVCAARVRGRLAAGRYLPRPGVCLPTNCCRSAATHSDELNKLPALAVWSRVPCGWAAAGSAAMQIPESWRARLPVPGVPAAAGPPPRPCSVRPGPSQLRQLPSVSAIETEVPRLPQSP